MTPGRSLLAAIAGALLLIGAHPTARDGQFPRGLMASVEPRTGRACRVETRPLSFGNYDPLAERDLDATGQVIYVCASGNGGGGGGGGGGGRGGGGGGGGNGGNGGNGDKQSVRIELWTGTAATFERSMQGPGSERLSYNIYLDATRQTMWGNGVFGDVYIDSHPPNGTPVTVPAFGRVFAGQNVEAGQFVDLVHVVILF